MNLACLVAVGVSVFLSPDDACVTAIMRELRRADSEIFVQAVAITLPDVLNGLDLAVKRGVKVTVDTMHSRAGTTIVIDRKTVIAGSLQLVPRGVGHLFIIKDDPDIARSSIIAGIRPNTRPRCSVDRRRKDWPAMRRKDSARPATARSS